MVSAIAATDDAETSRLFGETLPPHWLRRARDIVEAQFLEPLSLTAIASKVGVHPVHLSREFRKHSCCSLFELIRLRRVEHACNLLVHSDLNLAEIALVCGFSDQSHFSMMFKRHTGMTPSQFRYVKRRLAL
jgi:AraC-like DNA-binding protein